jgi:hypothetical protein
VNSVGSIDIVGGNSQADIGGVISIQGGTGISGGSVSLISGSALSNVGKASGNVEIKSFSSNQFVSGAISISSGLMTVFRWMPGGIMILRQRPLPITGAWLRRLALNVW